MTFVKYTCLDKILVWYDVRIMECNESPYTNVYKWIMTFCTMTERLKIYNVMPDVGEHRCLADWYRCDYDSLYTVIIYICLDIRILHTVNKTSFEWIKQVHVPCTARHDCRPSIRYLWLIIYTSEEHRFSKILNSMFSFPFFHSFSYFSLINV